MKFNRIEVLWIFLLFSVLGCGSEPTSEPYRDPIPLRNPFQDGYVFVHWNETRSESRLTQSILQTQEMGAKYLLVPVFGCQDTYYSSSIGSCDSFPSEDYSFQVAEKIMSAGTPAAFLPFLTTYKYRDTNQREVWRGWFEPNDLDSWFNNYTQWILNIARQAQSRGMTELVVASELSKINPHTDRWKSVIAEIRTVFSGALIFNVNWSENDIGIWNAVDAIGYSAYFPLSNRFDPSQEELNAAWMTHKDNLLTKAMLWNRPLYFTEVGYRNTKTAPLEPSATSRTDDSQDDEIQVKCFKAFQNAWENDSRLGRVFFWHAGTPPRSRETIRFNVKGKPAEAILKTWIENRSKP